MRAFLREKLAAPSYGTLLFICCGLAFVSYVGSYMRIPVVPLFAKTLGATTVEVGLINSLFLLMAGLLSFPLGVLSDRLGRKPLILWGLSLSSLTAFLLYVSRTPGQLMGIYLFFGVALALVSPTLMSYVADFSPPSHLGRSYGWYTTAVYGGMSLGPALGGWVAQEWGFRPLFLCSGTLVLIIIWLALAFLPKTAGVHHEKVTKPANPRFSQELLKNRPLQGCWLATLGGCFGLGMFVTFSPLHAHNQGLSIVQIGLVFAAQGICNALSRIPFGRLSDRVRRRWPLAVLGFIAFGLSIVAFGLSRNFPQFLLSAIALGVSMALAFTPVGALVAEVVPPQSRGLALGGYNTCIYLGMMLSSALMGSVIARIGFESSFLLTGLTNLLLTGLFYLLIKDFSPYRLEG
ncbi:MAG: MFS transporter [Thermodesulfobacteriota bacterium]